MQFHHFIFSTKIKTDLFSDDIAERLEMISKPHELHPADSSCNLFKAGPATQSALIQTYYKFFSLL